MTEAAERAEGGADKAWQQVTATAILGTERQTAALPAVEGPVGELLGRLEAGERERALLLAAGTLALYRRAGQIPAAAPPDPEAAPPDPLPRVNPPAGARLAAMLGGERDELLPEWLAAAATAGQRAPEDLLQGLLDLGAKEASLREALLPLLGERGRWLAAQRDDWAWVAGGTADDEGAWETGSRAARELLLRRLRAREPARALEMLQATWEQEGHDERAAFVAALAAGLSPYDETFLEAALDDRRKEIRRTAADLLARLPESRLCARMLERLRPLLAFTPGQKGGLLKAGKKPRLEVTLPAACDKAMVRDGVEPKPPHGIGEKAWWLQQMLGAVPPATWSRAWETTADEALAAATAGEWKKPLLEGWATAAARHADAAWAEALLPRYQHEPDAHLAGLVGVLPPERREALLLGLLAEAPNKLTHLPAAAHLLVECRHTWSPGFGRAVLARLRECTENKDSRWHLRMVLDEIAPLLPPSLSHEAALMFGGGQGMQAPVDLLQFRHDMLEEIRS